MGCARLAEALPRQAALLRAERRDAAWPDSLRFVLMQLDSSATAAEALGCGADEAARALRGVRRELPQLLLGLDMLRGGALEVVCSEREDEAAEVSLAHIAEVFLNTVVAVRALLDALALVLRLRDCTTARLAALHVAHTERAAALGAAVRAALTADHAAMLRVVRAERSF